MFKDARRVPKNTKLEFDIAIIGGGAAGITIARELIKSDLKIGVIESGGLKLDDHTQALYEGELAERDYPLAGSRARYLGGSSNHWGGYTRPLDPIDFEARDWVPDSGWPIDRETIDPYYIRAAEILQIGPLESEHPDFWFGKVGETDFEYDAKRLQTRFFQFSPPTRFGEIYRADLKRPRNLTVLLNANVVDIVLAKNAATVNRVKIRCLNGNRLVATAKVFVLATGGLENPRLLLASNRIEKNGLGNSNDLVGRYFMEHPHLANFCEILIARPEQLPSLFLKNTPLAGASVRAIFSPRQDYLRSHLLLNIQFSVARLANGISETSASHTMMRAASGLLREPGRPHKKTNQPFVLSVGCSCEQTPNPASRVTLSKARDPLNVPRIRLDWHLVKQERLSFIQHLRSLGLELGAMGIGRLRMTVDDEGDWPDNVRGGSHHMGTTRMADNPKKGVVDANCLVHGVSNLYVAGSSVFPTGGAANPTLTLIALALRLADHIKETIHEKA